MLVRDLATDSHALLYNNRLRRLYPHVYYYLADGNANELSIFAVSGLG